MVGGTGRQGFGLALRLAQAGHRLTIGSRSSARADEAAARALGHLDPGADVHGAVNADAIAGADLVVVAVPPAAQEDAYRDIAPNLKRRAIVVDTTNPIAAEVKAAPGEIRTEQTLSAAERAAAVLAGRGRPDVRIVAAFQGVAATRLKDLGTPLEGDVLLCGDEAEAKTVVGSLIDGMPNLRWIDAGGLSMARAVERFTGLLISVNKRYRIKGAGVRLHGHPRFGPPPDSSSR